MAKQRIKRSLRARLQRLEAELKATEEPSYRFGIVRPLPPGYTGEKHVVIVEYGNIDGDRQWCKFEERAGPPPSGPRDPVPWIYYTEQKLRVAGYPIED